MTPPILALHGNLGTASDWDALGLPNCRAVDLWDLAGLSFFEMAHELATTLSEGLERPVLAGYSLGGRLALHALAIHPERWGGAVILSAHPGLADGEARTCRREVDAEWARLARELRWDEFLERWNGQGVLADSPVPDGRRGLEARREEIALAFETWSLGRQGELRSQLRRFHEPVLWITGENDEKFTGIGAEMASVFPEFRHEILKGAGHRVLLPETGETVREWIEASVRATGA